MVFHNLWSTVLQIPARPPWWRRPGLLCSPTSWASGLDAPGGNSAYNTRSTWLIRSARRFWPDLPNWTWSRPNHWHSCCEVPDRCMVELYVHCDDTTENVIKNETRSSPRDLNFEIATWKLASTDSVDLYIKFASLMPFFLSSGAFSKCQPTIIQGLLRFTFMEGHQRQNVIIFLQSSNPESAAVRKN